MSRRPSASRQMGIVRQQKRAVSQGRLWSEAPLRQRPGRIVAFSPLAQPPTRISFEFFDISDFSGTDWATLETLPATDGHFSIVFLDTETSLFAPPSVYRDGLGWVDVPMLTAGPYVSGTPYSTESLAVGSGMQLQLHGTNPASAVWWVTP